MAQELFPFPPDDAALDRYLAGDASDTEHLACERWLALRADERRILASIQAGVVDPFGTVPPYDVDARVAAVVDYSVRAARRSRTNQVPAVAGTARYPRGLAAALPWYRRSAYQVAGAVSLCAATLALVFGVSALRSRFANTGSPTRYATADGQRAVVQLPDGSSVTLNVASRVEVPADFSQGNRTIRVEGQALFTVAHRAGTPFTVINGRTTTRVLGTTFMVRHYATDTAVTIAVKDGKVAVGDAVLSALEQVTVDKSGHKHVAVADTLQFAFANNVFSLPWMPLSSAIPELNRWYDVDIRVADPQLLSRKIQAVSTSTAVGNLAATLELMLNVRAVRNGRVLTLYPR